jgi:hypothetical protein
VGVWGISGTEVAEIGLTGQPDPLPDSPAHALVNFGGTPEKELRTSNNRNKKIVQYILFELEHHLSGQDFDVESAPYGLEHILPEHPSDKWDYISEKTQKYLIYRIGNMTLLETGRNRDIGNADYSCKLEAYRNSVFKLTKSIAEHYDTWDEYKVEARQKQLAKAAVGIWKIDFGG